MSAKHTPGPWRFLAEPTECSGVNVRFGIHSEKAVGIAGGQSQEHMADIDGSINEAECRANAALICAAPDLLAVAQFFLRGIEGGHIRCAPYIDFDPNAETLEIKSPATRLREAIAKATGAAE